MMKKIFIYLSLILICFFITACNQKNASTDPIIEPVVEKKLSIIDLDSNTRPIAVVINNHPVAVKVQTGLQDAYLIYEFPVEYGLSRSLAFYKDKTTSKIGTVRSARHDFLDYIMENDAIFAHYGWSVYAKDQIPQLKINNLDGNTSDPGPYWRENPEKLAWEHRVYTDLTKISNRAKEKKYRMTSDKETVLEYSVDEININDKEKSKKANSVFIEYSGSYNVKFTYDSENKVYKRYVKNKAHIDYFTKEHYTTKNIIVTRMGYKTLSGSYLELYNTGEGDGYYITNGFAVPIKWNKKDRSSQTIYKYLDGTEIKVNDGNTYIMLQLTNKKLTIE